MDNSELLKLKQDIINTKNIVKKNQIDFKEKIDNGWLDDVDEILENNPNYFQEQLQNLNPFPKNNSQLQPKKGISKLIEILKKFV